MFKKLSRSNIEFQNPFKTHIFIFSKFLLNKWLSVNKMMTLTQIWVKCQQNDDPKPILIKCQQNDYPDIDPGVSVNKMMTLTQI